MAIVPCGSTWVARCQVQPHCLVRSSNSTRGSTSSHCASSRIGSFGSQSSTFSSQESLNELSCPVSCKISSQKRGSRLVVRADRDYYSVLGVSKSSSKAEIKTGFLLPRETIRLCNSSFAAGVGNTTAVTNEFEGHIPYGKQPNFEAKDEPDKKNRKEQEDTDAPCEKLNDSKMLRVCNKLIEVFLVDKPTPADWRRLLTFSKEWDNIRVHFYKRCQDRSESESDPGMKHKILRLAWKLKEIDEDIQRHNKLLDAIRNSPSEVGDFVARRRKDFTKEFFVHLNTVAESYYDNPEKQNTVAKLGNTIIAAVQAYDTASESIEALNAAELKLEDIINSPSVDAAYRKIDSLAEKNQLDSALVLMVTKAWSAAKESNLMKDEVKDILYHLYKTSRGNLQRLMPKEVRILKYLLTIEDPEERMSALNDAFTPGQELQGQDIDSLYTTPEQLHTWIRSVIDAYHFSREGKQEI